MQFLKEAGLKRSLEALEEETGIPIGIMEDPEATLQALHNGQWDRVLEALGPLRLTPSQLAPLHEQIFWELAQEGHIEAAQRILREGQPLGEWLRHKDEARYVGLEDGLGTARLAKAAGAASIDLAGGAGGTKKAQRRAKLAKDLAPLLGSKAPSGRLMTLFGEALAWERAQLRLSISSDPSDLLRWDIFRGLVPSSNVAASEDAIPSTCYKSITLPTGQHIEAAAFSPDGLSLVVGLADGFIEPWSMATGEPIASPNQQKMVMQSAILTLAFAPDNQVLAAGTLDGEIGIWKPTGHQLVRSIDGAHQQGVASLTFNPRHPDQVLSAGYDGAVRLWSCRTGALMKEFRGHHGFVYDARFSADGSRVLSAGADGTLRVWDVKSAACIVTHRPAEEGGSREEQLATKAVRTVAVMPGQPGAHLCAGQWASIKVIGANGAYGRTVFSAPRDPPAGFLASFGSPKGRLVYGLSENGKLYAWDYASGTSQSDAFQAVLREPIGAIHHPSLNLMLIWDAENTVNFYKA